LAVRSAERTVADPVMKQTVRTAVAVLRRGGVIAYPTETTYGLGCDPRNTKAVTEIFRIKGRENNKPLLLVASSVSQVRQVADLVRATQWVAPMRYWPGPLTLVLPAKTGTRLVKALMPHGEVAIRVSSSSFVQALCRSFGFPIVSTTANRSGKPDCRSGKAVIKIFRDRKHQPHLIIDLGALSRCKPSTVARVREDGTIQILRQGAVRISGA